jgi:hypothetical protein
MGRRVAPPLFHAQIDVAGGASRGNAQLHGVSALEHDTILFAMKNTAKKPVKRELPPQAHDIDVLFLGYLDEAAFEGHPEGLR